MDHHTERESEFGAGITSDMPAQDTTDMMANDAQRQAGGGQRFGSTAEPTQDFRPDQTANAGNIAGNDVEIGNMVDYSGTETVDQLTEAQ